MQNSRIPKFYKLSVPERVQAVHERGWLTEDDYEALSNQTHTLTVHGADKMIENVIGVMGLPVGLGLNFLINGKDYVVPLVVEEPSIVAALSSAAKVFRAAGGFTAQSTEPVLIGQIQVVNVPHLPRARAKLLQRRDQILNLANSLHPKLIARGGGARDIEVITHPSGHELGDMLVVHLLVDTRDAMGANLVNTMCEGVASLIEKVTEGKVFLRILSNLTDRSVVTARATVPIEELAGKGYDGEQVRDGIIVAGEFAAIDPYRAATHNKGIMNGIDAVALATGNDWRAIEAGAHAYAARGRSYTSLTRWSKGPDGELVGEIEVPIKVGIVGGPLESNPTVAVNLRLLGVEKATELAEVMAAVGLAQNFAALRALATDGIQKGHMSLHARSVAMAAGATPEIFDSVVQRLLESREIKIWKAREIVSTVRAQSEPEETQAGSDPGQEQMGSGHGKAILLGEHAVVYGRHAIAAPIHLAVQARVRDNKEGVRLVVPRWGMDHRLELDPERRHSFEKPAAKILEKLELSGEAMRIEVFPNVPRAVGLGGSAAVAVAIIRALDIHFGLGLSEEKINDLAFEAEKIAHGTPSGVDNTVATYGQPIVYCRDNTPRVQEVKLSQPIPIVVGFTGVESLTAKTVAAVRKGHQRYHNHYERLFDQIDDLTLQGLEALKRNDLEELGELMNLCQGLLNALQVSSWELEELIGIARSSGALGAKLTGGGGGGSMIALCPDNSDEVIKAMEDAGYQAMEVTFG